VNKHSIYSKSNLCV